MVQRRLGTPNAVNGYAGRIGRVLHRQAHFQVYGHVAKEFALHAHEADLVVILPRHVVAGTDMDVVIICGDSDPK